MKGVKLLVKARSFYSVREAVQKKNAEETLVHTGGRGVKNALLLAHQKGDIFLLGRGQKLFVTCPMFNFVFLSPLNLWQFLMPYIMKIFYIT